MFSGDICLNSWSVYNHHGPKLKERDTFKIKELHLLHLNVNRLRQKVDEIRYIARLVMHCHRNNRIDTQ